MVFLELIALNDPRLFWEGDNPTISNPFTRYNHCNFMLSAIWWHYNFHLEPLMSLKLREAGTLEVSLNWEWCLRTGYVYISIPVVRRGP